MDVIDAHPDDPRSTTKDNTVSNNVVTNVADQYTGSLGIFAGYTDHTVISHNKVCNLPYSGISLGWGWGLTDKGGNTNYLPGNAGVPIRDTPTVARNNVISDNRIYDIYHDEGSQYFRTTQNAFCDVAYQWMLLNHGLDGTAENNFTTQPRYSAQGNTLRTTVAKNTTVDGCQQLPASIVNNAGLQPQYRNLDPDPTSRDCAAPSALVRRPRRPRSRPWQT